MEEHYEKIMARFVPNGIVDRNYIQKELTEEFILELLLRCDHTVEVVVEKFTNDYYEILCYLGEPRQDEMLKDAQASTGIDLSAWIGEEV